MTTSARFSAAFDATNQDHVLWIRALHLATLSEQAPDTLMKSNPFGVTVKKSEILDWVDVMFALSMKYAMTIIEGKDAYIPPKKSEGLTGALHRVA